MKVDSKVVLQQTTRQRYQSKILSSSFTHPADTEALNEKLQATSVTSVTSVRLAHLHSWRRREGNVPCGCRRRVLLTRRRTWTSVQRRGLWGSWPSLVKISLWGERRHSEIRRESIKKPEEMLQEVLFGFFICVKTNLKATRRSKPKIWSVFGLAQFSSMVLQLFVSFGWLILAGWIFMACSCVQQKQLEWLDWISVLMTDQRRNTVFLGALQANNLRWRFSLVIQKEQVPSLERT